MVTLGTSLGGWPIVRTVGRRIFPLRAIDGLVSQSSSAGVIIAGTIAGVPISTSQVVASSIVGIGSGRRRWRHVGWGIVARHRAGVADDDAGGRAHRRPLAAHLATHRELNMAGREAGSCRRPPTSSGCSGAQAAATIEGMAALTAWAAGDPTGSDRLRAAEHAADDHKRTLQAALRTAFVTPIGAEDIYVLSERLDAVLNGAKDAVRESEVLDMPPDDAVQAMSELIAGGVGHLATAFERLARRGEHDDGQDPTEAADRGDPEPARPGAGLPAARCRPCWPRPTCVR